MKVLCHAGPWSDTYLKFVTKGIDPKAHCVLASAHQTVDETNLSRRYYDFLKINAKTKYIATAEDTDIILRCRLLRALKLEKALLHLNSMRDAMVEVFDTQKPDIVLSETIDAYVMDLMYFECIKRNIPFVGLVTVFVNGYVRISARGEYNFVRQPAESEVEKALEMLENRAYLPSFVSASKASPKKAILTRWARNVIKVPYFILKRIISGEKYNYHYWATLIVSWNWFHLRPRFEVGTTDWLERLNSVKKPIIYLPLQFVPEATVDYWCQSLDVIDYDKTLLAVLDKYQNDFHFLIKEHPNVLGFRNPKLYDRLSERSNVTLCPAGIPSNELTNFYDAVLVWTGTVGFECALRGKPVLTLATPYYHTGGPNYLLIDLSSDHKKIENFIFSANKELDIEVKKQMVRHVLSGVVPGTFRVDGTWDVNKESDVDQALRLGQNLSDYVNQLVGKRL